ncbi:transporter substrate-binding domain-containing protein [Roseibium sp.]|uniref:transporter substrate-binding domain-containing protein n=1 Tax=Roseibium sp. TaxID=1936156 RepID=UPI003A9787B2
MTAQYVGLLYGLVLAFSPILPAAAADEVLRLGIRVDAPPFSSRVETAHSGAKFDEMYTGFSVSLCSEVVQRMKWDTPDLRVEVIPVTAQTRFPKEPQQYPTWDLLCDPTSVTLLRFDWCRYSFPYFVTGIAYATHDSATNPENLGGQLVALVGKTTTDSGLKLEWSHLYGTPPEFVVKDNYEEAVLALKEGEVKAVFGDQILLQDALEKASMSVESYMSSDILSIELYSFCVNSARPNVLTVVNVTLADLYRSGKIIELLGESFDGRGANRLLSTLYRLYAVPEK